MLISLLLTSLFTTGILAADKAPTEKQIDKYLKKAGYPTEVISLLELPQKAYIFEEKAVYDNHKIENGKNNRLTILIHILQLPNTLTEHMGITMIVYYGPGTGIGWTNYKY